MASYAARFAFVAHDVKTVSGGLKLLLGNAEDHIADPEFQRDMLITVRAATARIDTLIARLREPADALSVAGRSDPGSSVRDLPERLRAIARSRGPQVAVECDGGGGALGHPMVYLTLSESGRADCPYCGRRFELKPGAKAGHGH